MQDKPYALSCDRNQGVILETLKKYLPQHPLNLLEVGSGTGQHAIFCAPHFPKLKWWTSDISSNHSGIQLWMNEFNIENVLGPLEFEIGSSPFPQKSFEVVFTANTLHIMSWENCKKLIELLGSHIKDQGLVMIYGAFKYQGDFTSASNQRFDQWLKQRNSQSGIRDFEKIERCFHNNGFELIEDLEMPAHNQFLVFHKNDVS